MFCNAFNFETKYLFQIFAYLHFIKVQEIVDYLIRNKYLKFKSASYFFFFFYIKENENISSINDHKSKVTNELSLDGMEKTCKTDITKDRIVFVITHLLAPKAPRAITCAPRDQFRHSKHTIQ